MLDKVLGDKHQNATTPGILQEPAQTQSLSDIRNTLASTLISSFFISSFS